jgi:capsular polysaccharide transport system permease protein
MPETRRGDRAEAQDARLLPDQERTQTVGEATSALEESRAPEVIRNATVQVLSERIRLLGVARSGAYEHYQLQLSNGFPIPPGEAAILELVRQRFPQLRSYHEIGSGLGTLPLMLAHDGFASVGIERDERRHLTATAILRELSAHLLNIESNCRLIGAPFPDAIADLDVSDSMAILTDFVSSQAPQDYVRLCRALAQYRYVLIDLQRFCSKRDSQAEQERLVEELAGYGLAPRDETIDLGGAGYYQLFECRPSADRSRREADDTQPAADAVAVRPAERAASRAERPIHLPAAAQRSEIRTRESADVALREKTAPPATASPPPLGGVALPPMPRRARRKRFGGLVGLSALLVIGIPTLLAVAYYGFVASSQYITTFQFAVRGPSQAAGGAGRPGASSMMAQGAGMMSPDSFVVTDYINSPQAIADVEREVDLHTMFAKPDVDFWSRLMPGAMAEDLNAYWTRMVWASFDLISGNVSVSVRAFTPQESFRLAQALIATSNEMFRKLNVQAQQDFVRAADENVKRAQEQLAAARQALFVFREESGGLVDPDRTAQAGAAITDELRKQLVALRTQHASIKASAPNSPMLPSLASQIAVIETQIGKDDPLGPARARLATPETLAEYQSLDMERQYADKQYTEALALRNQAYLTAQNQLSYLALFAAPTVAQTSLYPNRARAIASVVLAAAAAWFVGMLIVFALRDHLM